mmetsp:Transcript_10876/g.11680  ORF Transcript_10876/g.11680 Transcript_10876/m.11680 type:complete len:83 (+) Transcript_10876:399-647(+)
MLPHISRKSLTKSIIRRGMSLLEGTLEAMLHTRQSTLYTSILVKLLFYYSKAGRLQTWGGLEGSISIETTNYFILYRGMIPR